MLAAHLAPLPASLFGLVAIGSLLLSFVMLGSRWLRHYLFAFAAQSWLIAVLSAAVGFYGNYAELYIVAILTAAFRGVLLPYLIFRIIRRLKISREVHVIVQPSSSLVIGAFAVIFALAVSYRIGATLDLAGTIVGTWALHQGGTIIFKGDGTFVDSELVSGSYRVVGESVLLDIDTIQGELNQVLTYLGTTPSGQLVFSQETPLGLTRVP